MTTVDNKKLKTMSNKHLILQILLHAILIIIAIMVISPLLLLLFNSFKSNNEILNDPVAMPTSFTLQYIVNAMQQINFWQSLGVTFIVTFCSVTLLVLVSSFAAWGMTRAKSKLSDFMYMCFTAAMLIPFQSLMYPLVALAEKTGTKNIPGLIFMYGGFGVSMSIFLYHGFFKNIPISLEESAMLDGANIFDIFFKIVMLLYSQDSLALRICKVCKFPGKKKAWLNFPLLDNLLVTIATLVQDGVQNSPLTLHTGIGFHLHLGLTPLDAISLVTGNEVGKEQSVGSLGTILGKDAYEQQVDNLGLVHLDGAQHVPPAKGEQTAATTLLQSLCQ